jgi:hypothetical protein
MDAITIAAMTMLADPVCASTPTMLAALATNYGEHVVATGKTADRMQIFLTVNPKTGTWTVVYSGTSVLHGCILMNGTDMRDVAPPRPTTLRAPKNPLRNQH